ASCNKRGQTGCGCKHRIDRGRSAQDRQGSRHGNDQARSDAQVRHAGDDHGVPRERQDHARQFETGRQDQIRCRRCGRRIHGLAPGKDEIGGTLERWRSAPSRAPLVCQSEHADRGSKGVVMTMSLIRQLGHLPRNAGLFALAVVAAIAATHASAQSVYARGAAIVSVEVDPDSARAATPALGALVAEALQHNPELRAAAKETEAAGERVRPAGALEDPMLEAGLLNAPFQPFSLNRVDMTMKMLGLSQKLPYPGKRALREQVAAKDAETIGHGLRETTNRVVRDVKLAYFDLALTDETVRLLQGNRQILDQFLRIAESRYAVGQAAQADVLKAQT